MPYQLAEFKDYLGMSLTKSDGVSSSGIVTVRRSDIQSKNIIPIPLNTVFSVATGQSFKNPETAELNESQAFIPLLLQSVVVGFDQNIPAESEWNTPIAGITLYNGLAFTDGSDPVAEFSSSSFTKQLNNPSNNVLNLILQQSEKVCMSIIGNPLNVPATVTFKAGVFFLGRYYVETRSKTGFQIEGEVPNIFQERAVNPGIEDTKVHEGVMRILTGMLSQDRAVNVFMPEVESDTG